jgi:hypothetical protein
MGLGGLAVSALILLAPGAGVAAGTTPPTASYAVMYSDGDYIGQGTQRVFDTSNGTVTVSGSASDLTVGAAGGTAGDSYSMEFAAAPGDILVSGGVYTGAQRAPFREAGHPGIDISGSGRGCNTDAGEFEVKDIATDASGHVTRVWIVYTQYCEGGGAALWGEVFVNEPIGGTGSLAEPQIVRWPETDIGSPNTVVPVTIRAVSGADTITGASVTGTNAADFTIRADECSGKPLAAGASCQIWVKFVSAGAGTRVAALHLTDAGGAPADVQLQGFAHGGTKAVNMTSDSGDYIGAGQTYSYTPQNGDDIEMGGGRTYVGFAINGANGDWWYADFEAPKGDILVPGATYQATRYPFNNGGAGLDVSGNGRGCNTLTGSFTVNSASFASDGTVQGVSISFVQHCEGATPAFRGTLAYRAGDTTSPPPWMIPTNPVPAPPPSQSPPTISSFSPSSGQAGTTVTVNGSNFTGATGVAFNGASATYSVVSDTQISATVPSNATTGQIAVTTPAGTAVSSSNFAVATPPPPPPSPTITTFSPASGTPGTSVTISGANFANVTDVAFNGAHAVYNVLSASQIQTSVPSGSTTGPITVTTQSGTATSSSTFAVTGTAPSISSFTPASGRPGDTVTINGANFTGVSAVSFNGTSAVYNVVSASQIQTTVPSGATTGKITVTTGSGAAQSSTDFSVTGAAPTIASFSPTAGRPGDTVTITGSNLTGATRVTFNGSSAVFNVTSASQIQTSVPTGATTGAISVTTPNGSVQSSTPFTVSTTPTIASFTPASGSAGTAVTIAGTGFVSVSSVTFNGTPAVFNVASATQIQASVPSGATTGPITVTTSGGSAQSTTAFTVPTGQPSAPTVSSFSPSSGARGTTVTVTGTGFSGTSAVTFNGVAASFAVNSSTQLQAVVPANATTGKIAVTTGAGTAQSAGDFTVTAAPPSAPTISSFTPSSGAAGTTVTITGTNFAGASALAFNGTAAAYTVVSATQITATVPAGAATGRISVTTPGGTAQSTSDFTVPTPTPTPAPAPSPTPAPSPAPSPGGGGGGGSSGIPPDIHVDVTPSYTTTPAAGSDFDWFVTVSSKNVGGSSDVRLDVALPDGWTFDRLLADRGSGCVVTLPTVTCDVGFINQSASTHISFFGKVATQSDLAFTATATSQLEPEFDPTDNTLTLKVPGPSSAPSAPAPSPTSHTTFNLLPQVLHDVAITGSTKAGSTLRGVAATFAPKPSRVSYQWKLCRSTRCKAIAGATRLTLHTARAYAGHSVKLVATALIGTRVVRSTSKTVRIHA